MNRKFQLSAYLLLCTVVIVISLYLGQRHHGNCDKCNIVWNGEHQQHLVAAQK